MEEIFREVSTTEVVVEGSLTGHAGKISELSNQLYDTMNAIDAQIKETEELLKLLRDQRNVLIKNVTEIVNKTNS